MVAASRTSFTTTEQSLACFGLSPNAITSLLRNRALLLSEAPVATFFMALPKSSLCIFQGFKNIEEPWDVFGEGFPSLTQSGAST